MKKIFTLKAIIFSLFIVSYLNSSAQVVEPTRQDSVIKKDTTTATIQQDTTTGIQGTRAENVYFEVGGPGLALTINYDSRFGARRTGFGYRVGAGYFASGGNTVFTVPLGITYLSGHEDGSSFFEFGAGTTFLNSTGDNKGKTFIFDKVTGFIGTATIGYRYQPVDKGFNFRIGFVPIFYDEGIIAAGGVSFGYTFK